MIDQMDTTKAERELAARQALVPSHALLVARLNALAISMTGRRLLPAAFCVEPTGTHFDPRMRLTIDDMLGFGGPSFTKMLPLVVHSSP